MKALGGAAEVSRDLGIPYTTVAQWQQSGRIPRWRIPAVVDLALKKQQQVPGHLLEPDRAA